MAKTDWKLNDTVKPDDMNDIGEEINQLRTDVDNIHIPPATLTEAGIVQLSNKTDGTSETLAATEKAVRDAKNASVPRTGGVNMTGRLTMQQWGTFSGSPDGSVLYGSNCYLDGSSFKYENTHASLGARGIYMRYTGGAGPEVYMFDTGPVATTAGATFTPPLARITNTGDPWQKHKLTYDDGLVLNISNQDLNNVLKTGFYAGENITNAPGTAVGSWWYIEVIAMSTANHVKQIAMNLFTNTYQQRTNNGNGWSAWSDDLFQSGVDAKNGIVDAINAKGGSASTNDTWAQLADKIRALSMFKAGDNTLYVFPTSLNSYRTDPSFNAGIKPSIGGTFRVSFNLSAASTIYGATAYGRIYINGVPRGITRSTTNQAGPQTFVEDFTINDNDEIQLYIWTGNSDNLVSSNDFRIKTTFLVTSRTN